MRIKRVLAWLVFLLLTLWGTLAVVCSNLPAGARAALLGVFIAAALASAVFPKSGSRKMIWFSSAFGLLLAWWLLLPASNSRDWSPDVAELPYADIAGSTVTIRNIRNCDYRTETDYVVRRYDRAFNLDSLRSMDIFLVDWGVPNIAHAMVSFGFGGGKYLCFSIETRKTKGEEYSAVRGFFKQYELTYVAADERDVVRLRAAYRKGEDVYLYRLKTSPELSRLIFMDYINSVNKLKDRPRWYNALTANCTVDIWKHVVPYYPKVKFNWRILASGHLAEMMYELGAVDRTLPLPELKRRSFINGRAKAAGSSPAFSVLIRHGLPGFDE